ncbi:MAG: hypothetical protein KAS32_19505 [Candidatus Peribacteraceae bacterium]|nr:hypothetical protein [Candidatus Peribacteraceae bacterium]
MKKNFITEDCEIDEATVIELMKKFCKKNGLQGVFLTREAGKVDYILDDNALEALQAFVEDSGVKLLILDRKESMDYGMERVDSGTIDFLREFYPELKIERK